jgi:hypothetical protein
MKVEIGTVTVQVLFWEYLLQIFGIVSLQCSISLKHCLTNNFCNLLKRFAVA